MKKCFAKSYRFVTICCLNDLSDDLDVEGTKRPSHSNPSRTGKEKGDDFHQRVIWWMGTIEDVTWHALIGDFLNRTTLKRSRPNAFSFVQ